LLLAGYAGVWWAGMFVFLCAVGPVPCPLPCLPASQQQNFAGQKVSATPVCWAAVMETNFPHNTRGQCIYPTFYTTVGANRRGLGEWVGGGWWWGATARPHSFCSCSDTRASILGSRVMWSSTHFMLPSRKGWSKGPGGGGRRGWFSRAGGVLSTHRYSPARYYTRCQSAPPPPHTHVPALVC
jgi:hypothetical protein